MFHFVVEPTSFFHHNVDLKSIPAWLTKEKYVIQCSKLKESYFFTLRVDPFSEGG